MVTIHPLRRWLFERNERPATFASKAGISQGYLSEVLRYKKVPTLEFIARVSKATGGAITANDFVVPKDVDAA